MSYPFKRILCPVDSDQSAAAALCCAAQIAGRPETTVYLLHVVRLLVPPDGMLVGTELYRSQDEAAWHNLEQLARKYLGGVNYELMVGRGDPPAVILQVQKRISCDLTVMATHGRRGLSRFLLGSVTDIVVRRSNCPVLTLPPRTADKRSVAAWMTSAPVVAGPHEKLASLDARMRSGGFRTIPVVKEGRLVGLVTDQELHRHANELEQTEAGQAMTQAVTAVGPETTLAEATELLRQSGLGALAIVEHGKLVGILTPSDVRKAADCQPA
jgi:nucleotide-binding universal stress UspA family protein